MRYSDFVADPLATIESVYDRLGCQLTGSAADAMRSVQHGSAGNADSAGGPAHGAAAPRHQYALAEFGLTAGQVDERFAAYLSATGWL